MGNEYEKRLGTEKMLPLVMRMALPSVAAQLVNMLYSIVDRIYIGHIPDIGTDALAGIGVTNSIILLISAFSQIVGGGGAPRAAIALGAGDRERAEKILGNGFTLLLIFTAVTVSISFVLMEPLLSLTGASSKTMGYAKDYLSVYLVGTLFVQITTGLNSFINSQGRPGIAMVSVLVGAALNIALDPLFIYTFGMGVKGAALATILSQMVSAVWVLGFLTSKKATLRLSLKHMRPEARIVGATVSLGIAPFIMTSTESLIGFVLNGSLAVYGDIYVSALTVLQSATQIVSVPLAGFAQGVVPLISYNYGNGRPDRVKQGFKILVTVMFSVNCLCILLMIAFPATVASLFTSDAELIAVVRRVMPIFMAGMTIFGLQRACQNMFVSLGQAKTSLFIALLRKVILLVPLALILPRFMGVTGVYAAEAIADATAATLCTVIFFIRFPKILRSAPLPRY